MMISNSKRQVSSLVQFTIVAITVFVFSLNSVCAQEFESIQQRLNDAVESGELSIEQSGIMMTALRAPSSVKKEKSNYYVEPAQKIEAKPKEGELIKKKAKGHAKAEEDFEIVFSVGKNGAKREKRYVVRNPRAIKQIFDREGRMAELRWEDEMAIGDKPDKAVEAKNEGESRTIELKTSAPKKTRK